MRAWIVVVVVVVVAWSGCLISPVRTFGAGKSRQQVVHEQAAQLTPNRVRAVGAWSGDVQTKKIRVWADDEYRAQHVQWQQSFQEILDDANEILATQFGVRLTPEFATWSYRAPGVTLDETLAALAAHDPGNDVFVVVGLTSSLALATTSFDTLGVAFVSGRHLVIRGYSDIHERKALEMSFADLRKEERAVMFDARKHHKRLSLLLHELGHTFGAEHATDPASLMTPSYSVQATMFDDTSRAAITANLDARLGRASRVTSAPTAPTVAPKPPDNRREKPPLVLDPQDTTPVIEIVIDADGRRLIRGKPQADAMLDGVFLLAYDQHKRTRVYVRTFTDSPAAVVDDVVARAKKVGLLRVIVTGD